MYYIRVVLLACALLCTIAAMAIGTSPAIHNGIVDVSWPNCTDPPSGLIAHGILGVTGGLNFRPNPCLATERTWFGSYQAYMNTGYPGVRTSQRYASSPRQCSLSDVRCLAYNYGFHAARYALQYAALQNVHASMWWLDVETENSWSTDILANQAMIAGAIAAIPQATLIGRVGIYSTPYQGSVITGGWENGLPEWIGTGETNSTAAALACKQSSFTGGPRLLSQYINVLDNDVP